MNDFLDRCLWCALQVTLFTTLGATLYLLLRKQSPARSPLPSRCLAVVAALSILTIVPWPSWNWQLPVKPLAAPISPSLAENDIPSIKPQPTLEPPTATTPIPSADQRILTTEPLPPTSVDIAPDPINLLENWKPAFILFAVLVGIAALLRLLIATRELFKRLRTSELISDAPILEEFSQLQTQFQLQRNILLRQSLHDDMPATIGWRKPVVLLPKSWRNWSPSQRRAVLAHELAHIHNHDFATWIAVQAPLLLHSYHPLVHWLARRVRWEQELAADRHAIAILGDRNAYIKALAELALGHREQATGFSLAPTSSMILERLKMLRQTSLKTIRPISLFKRTLLLSVVCLAALAVSGLRGVDSTAIADEPISGSEKNPESEQAPTEPPDSDTSSITARIEVSPQHADSITAFLEITPQHSKPLSQIEFRIFQQSQLTLLKSDFVLKAALAPKKIAKLATVIEKGDDALNWLKGSLQVSFPNQGSLLQIQYKGKENPDDMVKIINAVIHAYRDEVHAKERTISSAKKKVLSKLRNTTRKELRELVDRRQTLARELGGKESDESAQLIKILTNRLDRVETNISRIEEEQLKLLVELEQQDTEPSPKQKVQSSFFEQRLQQLEEKQTDLFKELKSRSRSSGGALTVLQSEIEQLQEVLQQMDSELRSEEINEQTAAEHIRILQPATLGPAPKTERQSNRFKEKALSSLNAKQLKKLRDQTQQELNELIVRHQTLAKEVGGGDTKLASIMLVMLRTEINSINSGISKAQAELMDLEVGKTLATREANSPVALEAAIEEVLAEDPMMTQFMEEKSILAQQLRQLKAANKGGSSKQIKGLQQRYQRVELEERGYRRIAEGEIREKLKQTPNEGLAALMAEYVKRKDLTTKRLKELQKSHEEKMAEVLRKGEKSGALAVLESEIEQLQAVLRDMNRRLHGDPTPNSN